MVLELRAKHPSGWFWGRRPDCAVFRDGTQVGDISHEGFFLNKVRFDLDGRTYDVSSRVLLGGMIYLGGLSYLRDGPEVLATARHHGYVIFWPAELNDYDDLVVAGQQYTLRRLASWTYFDGSAGVRDRLVLSRIGAEVGRVMYANSASVWVDVQEDFPLPVVAFVGWLGHQQALQAEQPSE